LIRAAVIYDSNFGNNEKLAKALSAGLERAGVHVDLLKIGEFNHTKIQDYELICLGGPTHITRTSQNMRDFLDEIKKVNLRGKKGFCFGTRMDSRMNIFDINGSAKKIEGKLRRRGLKMVKEAVNVIVEGREGPLAEGSENRYKEIGHDLGGILLP
jgi:flavodoxin